MEMTFQNPTASGSDKESRYRLFLEQYERLIDPSQPFISLLANTAAALHEAFGFFWVGFYIVEEKELILGPFQGSVACYRIAKGKGVCGTAWEKDQTLIVPDVDAFPGHIACSSLSRSEIVIPVHDKRGSVKAVLDIDSDSPSAFDEMDARYLEEVARILSHTSK